MSTPDPSLPTEAAPGKPKLTGKPRLWEDLIVTGFGLATSTAVAWGSWWMAANWDFAPYTWMVNWILPVGAFLCGLVAAIGYWIGARVFNHRPSRTLLFNIVLVSITTFFMTHHYHYTNDKAGLVPIEKLMTFPEYLVQVTEHMTYKISRSSDKDAGTQLGKWGWGVAALQVLGFSFGGFAVYGMLAAVPYCDRCAKYLSQRKHRAAKWKDPALMHEAFTAVAGLINEGRLQDAINTHATQGEDRKLPKAILTMEVRKCPACERRRLRLIASQQNGSQWANVGQATVDTEEPLQMG